MLFYNPKDMEMKEEVINLIYFELAENKRFLIYDTGRKIKATDLTPDALEALGGVSDVAIGIHPVTGVMIPYFKHLTDKLVGNCQELPNWYGSIVQNQHQADAVVPNLIALLNSQGISVTEEDARTLVYTPLEARTPDLITGLDRKLLEYGNMDMEVNRKLQGAVMANDVSYKHKNINYEGITSNDQIVGYALPKPEIIVTHTLNEEYDIKNYASFFNAYPDSPLKIYPNRLYKFKYIERILKAKDAAIRANYIKEAISYAENNLEIKLSEKEKAKIRAFEVIPLEHVLGSEDNDNIELMPNEIPFYENLVDFIKYHIELQHKEVLADKSPEEIRAKAEEDFQNGNIPLRLEEYLTQLLESILKTSYYHTANFNYVIGEDDGEDDDDDNYVVSASSASVKEKEWKLVVTKKDPSAPDLDARVADYLRISSKTYSASVWAEAILKLMRWGDRKVRNLRVGINNTQYLDLQTMEYITDQLADLSGFEVDYDEQGRSLDIVGMSYVNFTPEGERRPKAYPFILYGKEYGTLPNVDEEIQVPYLTTLFDIVKSYKEGKPNVLLLGYDGDKFFYDGTRNVTDLPTYKLDLDQLAQLTTQQTIPDDLTDYAITNAITDLKSIASAFLNQSILEDFISKEDLLERLSTTPKPMRSLVLQGSLISIFQEGAQDYDTGSEEEDLIALLNWYKDEIFPTHLEAYNNLLGIKSTGEKPDGKINALNLQAAHFFTGVDEGQEAKESDKFMYSIYEGEKPQFKKVYLKPGAEKVLFGVTVLPDKGYVFAAPDEIESYEVNGQPVYLSQVVIKIFEVMLDADGGNALGFKHKVMSDQTMAKIHTSIHSK